MRATVSQKVGGLKVHVDASFGSKVKDEIEPGMEVVVLDARGKLTQVSYSRRYQSGTREHGVGWVSTALLDMLPDDPPFDEYPMWKVLAVTAAIILVAVAIIASAAVWR